MAHGHSRTDIHACLAVLTVSDSRTVETDRSGPAIRKALRDAGHEVFDHDLLPDEPVRVANRIRGWLDESGCDGVIVNGGTGISDRDRTYEAVSSLLEKRLDGFGELFRSLSYGEIGSAAMLSRATAGIAAGRVVFSVPGSTPAVTLAMERLILPELPHLLGELRKDA